MSKWDKAVSGLVAVEPSTSPVAMATVPKTEPHAESDSLTRLTVSMPRSEHQAADAVRRLHGLAKTPAASEVIRAGLAALRALPQADQVQLLNEVIARR